MITIQVDDEGLVLPDVEIEAYVREQLRLMTDAVKAGYDQELHIGGTLLLDCIRAVLLEIHPNDRPPLRWVVFGREVHFDKHMRSEDAWDDPRMQVQEDVSYRLLSPPVYTQDGRVTRPIKVTR